MIDFTPEMTGACPFFKSLSQSTVGQINNAVPSQCTDLLFGSALHAARRLVRLENPAVRCGQKDSVMRILKY